MNLYDKQETLTELNVATVFCSQTMYISLFFLIRYFFQVKLRISDLIHMIYSTPSLQTKI